MSILYVIFPIIQIITVKLNRGWNCRLGFSLRSDPVTKGSVISAIYKDSIAAKDGRLRAGDQIIQVSAIHVYW